MVWDDSFTMVFGWCSVNNLGGTIRLAIYAVQFFMCRYPCSYGVAEVGLLVEPVITDTHHWFRLVKNHSFNAVCHCWAASLIINLLLLLNQCTLTYHSSESLPHYLSFTSEFMNFILSDPNTQYKHLQLVSRACTSSKRTSKSWYAVNLRRSAILNKTCRKLKE